MNARQEIKNLQGALIALLDEFFKDSPQGHYTLTNPCSPIGGADDGRDDIDGIFLMSKSNIRISFSEKESESLEEQSVYELAFILDELSVGNFIFHED